MSKVLWLCFASVAACLSAWGQGTKDRHSPSPPHRAILRSSAAIPVEAQAALAGMVARATVIFAGQVLEVAPNQGFVDVTFRVDEPVRGCSKLGIYVLREWAGLWDGQPARYRAGQRLMMLLTARGPSGMSAPVGGDEGILPIVASAVEPIADATGEAPAEDGSVAADIDGMTADLRWVLARAVRPVAYGVAQDAGPVHEEPLLGVERWSPVRPFGAVSGPASAQPTVGAVLALLRSASGNVAGPVAHPIVSSTENSGSKHEEQ